MADGGSMAERVRRVCAVVGVGPGNGAALARRFARDGYTVALLARSRPFLDELERELPDGRGYTCDVTDEAQVKQVFARVAAELGPVEVLVYNAGSGTWGNVEEISPAQLEAAFRVNAYGALVAAQQVIPAMKQAGQGAIIFIGATASRRGGARSAAFAAGKAAQRSLAESMARHLWPAGIHVALIVVDGVVDLASTRQRMPDQPQSFFISPDDVAEIAARLTEQQRSAWSFEVEARPFGETW